MHTEPDAHAAKLCAYVHTHHDLNASVLVVLKNVAVDLVVLAVLFAVDVVPADSNAGAEVVHAGVVPEDVGVAASVEAWLRDIDAGMKKTYIRSLHCVGYLVPAAFATGLSDTSIGLSSRDLVAR